MEIKVMTNILEKNDQVADAIHARLSDKRIFVINLLGSPGCGKTSLLEKTIIALQGKLRLAVIEGDLFTAKDAERIQRQGVPVVQINTSGGCHLDANMVDGVLSCLDLDHLDLIIIENVGNLVCPAEFNIGEDCKVTVLSITEGEDKPLKYPLIFREAKAVVLNKVDLLPYTEFNMSAAVEDIKSIHPTISMFPVSCRTGDGIDSWCTWLIQQVEEKKRLTSSVTEIVKIQWQIEQMRQQLHDLVISKKADFSDPAVAELSAKLDKLIVAYEKAMKNEGEKGEANR